MWWLGSCDWAVHSASLSVRLPIGWAKPGQTQNRPIRYRGERSQAEHLNLWPKDQKVPVPWQVSLMLTVAKAVIVVVVYCCNLCYCSPPSHQFLSFSIIRIGRPPKYRKSQHRGYQSEYHSFMLCTQYTYKLYPFMSMATLWLYIASVWVYCILYTVFCVYVLHALICVILCVLTYMYVFSCVAAIATEGMCPSLFMSALSAHPDRTLSLCWEQHCKLLPGVQGIHATQVAAWTVEEVRAVKLTQRLKFSITATDSQFEGGLWFWVKNT